MKIKQRPDEIWKEYQDGIAYNAGIFDGGLYETVERNNNFYNDKQWEGVNAPDLDKPVFNFLKPVVNFYIAMLISDDIAANVEFKGGNAQELESVQKAVSQEILNILERENMQFKNRRAIRNAAVDGDCCFYNWFDVEAETDGIYEGQIRTDVIDNTNVVFGDPSENDPQKQPYIIVVYRALTENVKEEAKENGMGGDGIESIVPDNDCIYMNEEKNYDKNYTTVLLKMWKVKKTVNGKMVKSVRMVKSTQTALVKKAWDTDYRRYPLSWMSWEVVKNSYHGVAPLTGKIQNQIFVNKMYAMAMMFTARTAFPKIIYDATKIPGGWDNRIGSAVKVVGNPNDALFANFQAADMSASVPNLINSTITQTKDLMGANETALGNVEPDNTSAIITVQNQARIQLDMQRLDFYNCVEGYIRSYIDMMRVHYGVREIEITDENGNKAVVEFDFSQLENCTVNLKVDVGQGSYWSEIMQIQTLDNLYAKRIIPSATTYLEMLPDGVIKNKQMLISQIKAMQPPASEAAGINPVGGTFPPSGASQPPLAEGVRSVSELGTAADGLNAGEAPQASETGQMKQLIEELAKLSPDQIKKTLEALPYSAEDKVHIIEILKERGVLG